MANKRAQKGCVGILICISEDADKEVIKYQASKVAKTGIKGYNKPEAASELFMELVAKKEK